MQLVCCRSLCGWISWIKSEARRIEKKCYLGKYLVSNQPIEKLHDWDFLSDKFFGVRATQAGIVCVVGLFTENGHTGQEMHWFFFQIRGYENEISFGNGKKQAEIVVGPGVFCSHNIWIFQRKCKLGKIKTYMYCFGSVLEASRLKSRLSLPKSAAN